MSLVQQSALVPEPFCIISVDGGHENPNKLFLGGIPSQATEKQLEEFFSQFGVVRDVRIVTDRITAECKGYGFVTFDDKEDIQHLVDRKTIRMAGKKIRIRKAIRRNSSQFDHIHTSKATKNNNNMNNENTLMLSHVNDNASAPIAIPSETYFSAETHVTTETYPTLETYHGNPVYFPLTPPESPEILYEFQNLSNASPNQLIMPSMPEIGLYNQQQNGVMMTPPLFHPNYPIIHLPRLPYPTASPSWFRY